MKINEGYKHIKVKLLSWDGDKIASRAFEFGKFALDNYKLTDEPYGSATESSRQFVDTLINGKTFPKLVLAGTRIDFEIQGISRICLAQLTRDSAIFASESHGLRPLSQEFNLPLSITDDKEVMFKLKAAQSLLEEAYILACEHEIPYPESRYLGLHAQTISVTASFAPMDFVRSCFSRTNNSFCDELNYVYRKMYRAIRLAILKLSDENSIYIWQWIFKENKCIDDSYYTRTTVFNGDFNPDEAKADEKLCEFAVNDWRKSGWKLELERIFIDEPSLLTKKEWHTIKRWMEKEAKGKELYCTYRSFNLRCAKNAIKEVDYNEK